LPSTQPVKLVAIDLDGTLVRNDENLIDPEEAEVIRQVQASGVTVVIATGRPHRSAAEILARIGLTTPIISFNGSMIKRPGEAEPMMHLTVPPDLAEDAVALARERSLYLIYFTGDDVCVSHMARWGWLYWQRTGLRPFIAYDLRSLFDRPPTKLIIMDVAEKVASLTEELSARYGGALYVTRSRPDMVELMNPGANKGAALRWLAEHLGVPIEQTAALGDAPNDAPLLEAAGIAVAMPGSAEELRRIADVVIEGEARPVATALRQVVLDGEKRGGA
jgi:Cof subfamily protein (haloacid dehalogenase superfamily)